MEIEFWRWATANFWSVLSARKELGRLKNKEPSAIALVVEWSKQRLPSVSAWGRILPPRTVKRSVNFFDCPQNSKRLCQYFCNLLVHWCNLLVQSPGAISWCNLLVQFPGGMAISWRNDAISWCNIAISWCNIAISWCNSNLLVQWSNLLVQ